MSAEMPIYTVWIIIIVYGVLFECVCTFQKTSAVGVCVCVCLCVCVSRCQRVTLGGVCCVKGVRSAHALQTLQAERKNSSPWIPLLFPWTSSRVWWSTCQGLEVCVCVCSCKWESYLMCKLAYRHHYLSQPGDFLLSQSSTLPHPAFSQPDVASFFFALPSYILLKWINICENTPSLFLWND